MDPSLGLASLKKNIVVRYHEDEEKKTLINQEVLLYCSLFSVS